MAKVLVDVRNIGKKMRNSGVSLSDLACAVGVDSDVIAKGLRMGEFECELAEAVRREVRMCAGSFYSGVKMRDKPSKRSRATDVSAAEIYSLAGRIGMPIKEISKALGKAETYVASCACKGRMGIPEYEKLREMAGVEPEDDVLEDDTNENVDKITKASDAVNTIMDGLMKAAEGLKALSGYIKWLEESGITLDMYLEETNR